MFVFVIGLGEIRALLAVGNREVAGGHLQRLKDVLAHKILPALSGNFANQVAGGHDEHIVVTITTAKIAIGLKKSQPAHQVFTSEIRAIPDEIVSSHTHSMRNEVTRGHALACDWIVDLEFREILPNRLVPLELAFVIQDSHGKRSEGFGNRTDRKDRLASDWKIPLDVTHTEPMRIADLPVLYYRNRQSRHAPLLHLCRYKLLQVIRNSGYAVGWRELRVCRRCSGQREQERERPDAASNHF